MSDGAEIFCVTIVGIVVAAAVIFGVVKLIDHQDASYHKSFTNNCKQAASLISDKSDYKVFGDGSGTDVCAVVVNGKVNEIKVGY